MKKIGVIGAGTMGHGIANAFAMYGYDVKLYDTNQEVLDKAKQQIREELELMASEDYIAATEVEASLSRIKFSTDLFQTAVDREYVI